jgi:hypothetical protein
MMEPTEKRRGMTVDMKGLFASNIIADRIFKKKVHVVSSGWFVLRATTLHEFRHHASLPSLAAIHNYLYHGVCLWFV